MAPLPWTWFNLSSTLSKFYIMVEHMKLLLFQWISITPMLILIFDQQNFSSVVDKNFWSGCMLIEIKTDSKLDTFWQTYYLHKKERETQ